MSKLIFRIKYSGQRWNIYLEEALGKEIAKKCKVESIQTALEHEARISILDYTYDRKLIDTLKHHESVTSAFVVENQKTIETIK